MNAGPEEIASWVVTPSMERYFFPLAKVFREMVPPTIVEPVTPGFVNVCTVVSDMVKWVSVFAFRENTRLLCTAMTGPAGMDAVTNPWMSLTLVTVSETLPSVFGVHENAYRSEAPMESPPGFAPVFAVIPALEICPLSCETSFVKMTNKAWVTPTKRWVTCREGSACLATRSTVKGVTRARVVERPVVVEESTAVAVPNAIVSSPVPLTFVIV